MLAGILNITHCRACIIGLVGRGARLGIPYSLPFLEGQRVHKGIGACLICKKGLESNYFRLMVRWQSCARQMLHVSLSPLEN